MGNPNGSSNQAQPSDPALSGPVNKYTKTLLSQSFGDSPSQVQVGFTPYQSQIMDQLKGLYSQSNPLTDASSGYASDVLSGKYLDPSTNPALARSADAISSSTQRFLNGNLDNLNSGFALAGGASSSALANARTRAAVDASTGLSSSLAGLYGNAYQNERATQTNMVPMAYSLAQDPIQRMMQALQLGGQEQSLQNVMQNMPYQNYLNRMETERAAIGSASGALQGIGSTMYMPTYNPSELSQNLGLAFSGMGAVGGLAGGVGKFISAAGGH